MPDTFHNISTQYLNMRVENYKYWALNDDSAARDIFQDATITQ